MLRRLILSAGLTILLLGALTATVAGQDAPADPPAAEAEAGSEAALAPSIQPLVVTMTDSVPVTLTLTLPGPSGVQTISLPVLLSFDIQIGLSDVLTASVAASAEQVEGEVIEVPPAEPTAEPSPTAQASPVVAATPTPTPARIEAPTPTPTAVPEEEEAEPEPTAEPEAEEVELEPTAEPEAEEAELVPTATPTDTVASEVGDVCSDPRSLITSPVPGEAVSGSVQVIGTAQHENFQYYKLEYAEGPEATDGYAFLANSSTQIQDGVLATFDSTEFVNGPWVLRLTVVDNTGNFPPPCEIPILVDN